jgi:hypothetical protein
VREQVVGLEDDADLATQPVEVDPAPVTTSPSMRISPDEMSSRPLMQRSIVDLPEPDGADQGHDLVPLDLQRHALQDRRVAVGLVHVPDLEERHQTPPERWRCWSRRMSRSTNRACGMVMRTNRIATTTTGVRLNTRA